MTQKQIKALSEEITKMAKKDQAARKGNNLDRDKIRLVDDKNRARMKEIVEKYGYISPSIYGGEVAKSAWLLIQHFPITEVVAMEHYLNLIKENPKGFDKKTLAIFEDRVLVYKKKPQIYGSQAYCPPNSKIRYFREIADIKNVDQRRREVGLEPLREYAAGMEADYGGKFALPDDYVAEE